MCPNSLNLSFLVHPIACDQVEPDSVAELGLSTDLLHSCGPQKTQETDADRQHGSVQSERDYLHRATTLGTSAFREHS